MNYEQEGRDHNIFQNKNNDQNVRWLKKMSPARAY